MKTNVIMLPIDINTVQPEDCVGFIFKNENGVVNILNNLDDIIKSNAYFKAIPQHLYIISDEEIKEGDWYYESEFQLILKKEGKGILKANKIIATTDTSLICEQERFLKGYKSELPEPSGEFIKNFVDEYNKGNIITDFLVEYKQGEWVTDIDGDGGNSTFDYVPKVNSNNTVNVIIKQPKESWNREELMPIIKKALNTDGLFNDKYTLKWMEDHL